MTLLIVEDNENIRMELSDFFRKKQFDTICPMEFENIENIVKINSIQGIILDINLDGWNGFDICKKIRHISNVPILFVTCRDSEIDEIHGIEIGGDDYIKKPYSLPVLMAKVNRMINRYQSVNSNNLYIRDVCLDVGQGQLKATDKILELSKNEMKILYYMFQNKEKLVTKDELIEYLWENKFYVDENILNVNLSRLRKRLVSIGLKNLIKTIPKKGYTITETGDP